MKNRNKINAYLGCLLLLASGASQAQTCNSAIIESTPTAQFTVHDDGTVTHKKTDLMWKVCTEGQTWNNGDCTPANGSSNHSWSDALERPADANDNGGDYNYTDWRLPNIKELASIAELKCHSPAINATIFPNTPSNQYWSSSVNATNEPDLARVITFGHGYDLSIDRFGTGANFVRLVRSAGP